MAIIGVLAISGDALPGGGGDDGSQLPGIALSILVLGVGLALLVKAPTGALRTAGSVATVAAVPAIMFFVTYDDGGFPPYSTEGILAVSAGVWILLHFAGPAAGRTFPLGAGLLAAWLLVLQVTEEPFTAPFDFLFFLGTVSFEEEQSVGGGFSTPNLETLGVISLVFGAAMVVVAHRLDRAGQRGRATAFTVAALPMLPAGVLLLTPELEAVGSGLLLVAIGVVLAAGGAIRERRFTTWAGAAFVFYGVGTVIDELVGDDATNFGLAAILAGAAIVVAAHFATAAFGEPDELVPGPSSFRIASARPPVEPPPPPPPPADPWSAPAAPPQP